MFDACFEYDKLHFQLVIKKGAAYSILDVQKVERLETLDNYDSRSKSDTSVPVYMSKAHFA